MSLQLLYFVTVVLSYCIFLEIILFFSFADVFICCGLHVFLFKLYLF